GGRRAGPPGRRGPGRGAGQPRPAAGRRTGRPGAAAGRRATGGPRQRGRGAHPGRARPRRTAAAAAAGRLARWARRCARCARSARAAGQCSGGGRMRPAFGRPLAVDSVLHRRDPTVKLAVLLIICLVLTAVTDPVTPGVLYLLTWPVALRAGQIPALTLLRAHLPFAAFALSLLLVNACTRPGELLARLGPVPITAEGLSIGAGLAVRTLLIGITSVTFVLTTDGARLMTSLHQHLRLDGRFAYAVLAGYRLLEQLPESWATIRAAQAARDASRR